ncbi:hypothetical protein FLL45_20950 [Aliikangiella marina]|uniref:Tetratricopeptide repeat protein n=1 Tax=Aliikangiella marina TaxID=1712262 RepID=A0A545T320_9GAMM|nr:tetratricopeptide repeat protein [Aliikangiella marina]TQV71621.1 hypothetical protein FLL45_20950 [Aliikangiella marina]
MKYQVTLFVPLIFLWLATKALAVEVQSIQGQSLLGSPLLAKPLDHQRQAKQINDYQGALKRYQSDPNNANALIWLGRRVAYLGDFQAAIKIFSEGIEKHPTDARFYRHRGHRFISTRQFDKAIKDFEVAVKLIDGKDDVIEPDGIPNAQNIPVSSLHSNIWYHLGLSYYLKNDLNRAANAFEQCLQTIQNNDNLVSASHWAYMIARESNNIDKANAILKKVDKKTEVIENTAYLNLLLFYKNQISETELLGPKGDQPAVSEAIMYGLGNWYLYNGYERKAYQIFEKSLNEGNWAAFGNIAAEAKLSRRQ